MVVVRVCLFGDVEVTWGETPLAPIASSVARSLFGYLLTYRDRPHSRDLLAGTFWPDLPDAAARRRLSQALWQIRKALDPHILLLCEGDTVQIAPNLPLWLDTEHFTRHKARCTRSGPGAFEHPALSIEHCELCIELYRGDFLAGSNDDWLLPERERLREIFLDMLEHLVIVHKRQGDYQASLAYARRLAAEAPLHEEAHREAMRLCHLLGRDGEALQQFETCCQLLSEQLGVEPSPETTTLAYEIAEGSGQAAQLDLLPLPPHPVALGLDSQVPEFPLVGRETERARILTHVEALFQGLGGIVLLEGEAGVGKTRLLRTIAGDARWRGADVLWGSGRQVEAPMPYGPLVEALSGGLDSLRVRQLTQAVDEIWLQVLTVLLSPLVDALPPPPALEPAQERDRLVNALAQLLTGWAQIVPLLLVVEDLHWAGEDTLEILARLVPFLSESGVLILGSYRSEEARTLPPVWKKLQALDRAGVRQRLVLNRLNAAATGELVRRSLGLDSPAPLLEARLFKETAGNPLFLLETLRVLYGEGLLFRDENGQWSTPWDDLTSDYAELPLPPAVEQIIARRLDALAPTLQGTVYLAAVLGERFDFDLLRTAGGKEPSGLLAALGELVQRRFLDETDQDYCFHHDKIRQVAYDNIETENRPRLHRLVAQALESLEPQRVAALAHHWMAARVWDKAAAYHRQAGDRARGVYANAEAASHYTQAMEALDHLPGSPDLAHLFDLRLARESMFDMMGERQPQTEDLAALERLARLLDDGRRQVVAALRYADYHIRINDYLQARRCLEQGLSLAQAEGDQEGVATGLGLLGQVYLHLGDFASMREYHEQALALCRASGDRSKEAQNLASCCAACLMLNDYPTAQAYCQDSLALFRSLGDQKGEGHALYLLGRVHRDTGRLAAAQACASQATKTARMVGDQSLEADYLLELGNLCSCLGDYATAEKTLQEAASIYQQIHDQRGYSYALLDLGLVQYFLSDWVLARDSVEKAHSLLVTLGDRWGEAGSLIYLGQILAGEGETDTAAEAFHRGLALSREIGQRAWEIEALAGLAHVALAQDRLEEAMNHNPEILAWLDQESVAGMIRPMLIYLTAHRVSLAAGDTGRAQDILVAAHRLVMDRADQLDDEHIRRMFLENVPEHRAILAAYRKSHSRSIAAHLPCANAPTGRPLRGDEYVTIIWTVFAPQDEAFAAGPDRRQAQLRRLLREAADQGAAPTVGDLAVALAVSKPTLRRDLAALRRAGHPAQTRGSRKE